jgi:diguanylate cyclase (GGDEF)-like protein/PAS domain S-box-containing protein
MCTLQEILQEKVYAENVADAVHEPLVILDADLKVIAASKAFFNTFQLNPKETENRCIFAIGDHQWDIPELRRLLTEILPARKSIEHFEVVHDFPALGKKVMVLNAFWIPREADRPHYIIVAIEDRKDPAELALRVKIRTAELSSANEDLYLEINRRKQAEEALKESENQYRTIFRLASVGIGQADQTGRLVHVNDRQCEITGYSREELLSINVRELTHPDDREEDWRKFSAMLRGETSVYNNDKRYIRKDGKIIWVHVEARAIRDDQGRLVRTVAIITDITERKRAEEALRKREEQMRLFIEHAPVAIAMFDTTMRYVAVSQRWLKDYNLGNQDLHGRSHYEVFPEISERVKDIHKRCLAGETERMEEDAFVRSDGSTQWLRWEVRPWYEQSGAVGGVILFTEDITERKRLGAEREGLIKELEQRSLIDSHTGLYNHRYLKETLEANFSRAERKLTPLSVIMIDLDYFKSINDVYGHVFGDLILRQFANQLLRIVRPYDEVIRYGGEEFTIVSPGTDRQGALILARRILDEVILGSFGDHVHSVKLKLSLAVATYPEDGTSDGLELVDLADRILNKAKENGGNRVYSSLDICKEAKAIAETSDVNSLKEKIHRLTMRANQSVIEETFAFAKTLELKDHGTGEHVERTVRYAVSISRDLCLPQDQIELIEQVAMLHDLGKVGISEKILQKKSKLSKEEYEEIKKHPQIGADILRPIHALHPVIPGVLYHHERWDGKGYPYGFARAKIPLLARIIAIADTFEALVSDRPYRKAYLEKEAVKIIANASGTQFDPAIVDTFLKILQNKKLT